MKKVILVGSPDPDTWGAVDRIYEDGDKVVPYGDPASGLPLSVMEIHMPRMYVIPEEHGPLMIHGTLELKEEIERIKRSLGGSLVGIKGLGFCAGGVCLFVGSTPTSLMNVIAVVGILTRQGIRRLVCIPGTEETEKDFGAIGIIAPSIHPDLKVKVCSIPQTSER